MTVTELPRRCVCALLCKVRSSLPDCTIHGGRASAELHLRCAVSPLLSSVVRSWPYLCCPSRWCALVWLLVVCCCGQLFPIKYDSTFPKRFKESVCCPIYRRCSRIYSHVYHHHYQRIRDMGAEAHLNTCCKHFIYFVYEVRQAHRTHSVHTAARVLMPADVYVHVCVCATAVLWCCSSTWWTRRSWSR